MAEKTYVVTAACAVVYNADRSAAVTVQRGGKVPPGSDPEHVKLLLDRGLIAEGEATGGLDVDPDAAPPFPAPAAAQRSSSYDGTSAPAKSASKADWVDWAPRSKASRRSPTRARRSARRPATSSRRPTPTRRRLPDRLHHRVHAPPRISAAGRATAAPDLHRTETTDDPEVSGGRHLA
jgi:hypothetical protein